MSRAPETDDERVDPDALVDPDAADALLSVTPADVDPAPELTFARNVFLPLTTACRYTCTYCSFYDVPGEASLMSPEAVRAALERGADAGCTEALFTFGDAPDARYTGVHGQLADWGFDSVLEYLVDACETALDVGLLPHSNPGDLTRAEFDALAPVNASMGVMLETTAEVAAHSGTRRKTPERRLGTIRAAGEAAVPFTTGILVGIGETPRDRAESLLAIAALHDRYDHVQEVIVQPVVPNERSDFARPDVATLRKTVAMARAALPPEVSVQVPPNLAPTRELLDCGVDDLGGVSPVTDDHINPSYEWPAVAELADLAADAGVPLRERLPVHGRYLPSRFRGAGDGDTVGADDADARDDAARERSTAWLRDPVVDALDADDGAGRRYRSLLR